MVMNLDISDILKKLYEDSLTINRYTKVTNPIDGTTGIELDDIPVITGVPCRISFGDTDNPEKGKEESNPIYMEIKIFCGSDVDIRVGDKLTVKRMGNDGTTILATYTGTANLPHIYISHKEFAITEVGVA